MELDGSYDVPSPTELEYVVRTAYSEGIKQLRETDDVFEQLEILKDMFSALSDSHPTPERGLPWAEDYIRAYRNLGRITRDILGPTTLQGVIEEHRVDYEDYGDVLIFYDGKNGFEKVCGALSDLRKIQIYMQEHDLDTLDDLERRLDQASEVEERIEKLEDDARALERL